MIRLRAARLEMGDGRTYITYQYVIFPIMQTITATDLARNTREVLDRVFSRGETVDVRRNQMLIARIVPPEPSMTAQQALAGLDAMLTPAQASAWLRDSHNDFDDAVLDPWG